MKFEWNEDKRRGNIEKHGIDFPRAARIFDGRPVVTYYSPRTGEDRWATVGELDGRLNVVVWTQRGASGSFRHGERGRAMKENIVRYTAEEIKEMIRRGEDQTDWARVDAMTDEDIRKAIADDPDAFELPDDWADHVIIGLPEPKAKISLRVDADVLRWFRDQGPRYQSRMNAVLRDYMERHNRPDGSTRPARERDQPPRRRQRQP